MPFPELPLVHPMLFLHVDMRRERYGPAVVRLLLQAGLALTQRQIRVPDMGDMDTQSTGYQTRQSRHEGEMILVPYSSTTLSEHQVAIVSAFWQ